MLSKRKKLEIASLVLALVTMISAAIAITFFTKELGGTVTVVGDWSIDVTPTTLDFGNLGMNEAANRSVTVTYIGNKPSTFVYWEVKPSTPLPSGMSIQAWFNGILWTDHRSIPRNTAYTAIFELDAGDSLAGDYAFTILVHSGDS